MTILIKLNSVKTCRFAESKLVADNDGHHISWRDMAHHIGI